MTCLNASKLHQWSMAICGLLASTAAIWNFAIDSYSGSTQQLVFRVVMHGYQIVLAFILLGVTALGKKQPLNWFGLLESFVGTGLYVIFLCFFSLNLPNDFGVYSSCILFVVGVLSVIYGLASSNARSSYPPLL